MINFLLIACGVAHQALDSINPRGDNILIQGILLFVLFTLMITM